MSRVRRPWLVTNTVLHTNSVAVSFSTLSKLNKKTYAKIKEQQAWSHILSSTTFIDQERRHLAIKVTPERCQQS